MADTGLTLLRLSLGVVYLWFGLLKFFPDLSPIEEMAVETANVLTFNFLSDFATRIAIAGLETLIGIGLILGRFLRVTLVLLVLQLLGATAPLFIFSEDVFTLFPYAPTLTGQYIIKDIIIVAAAIVIGSTIRGGKIVADPEVAEKAKKVEEGKLRNSLSAAQ